MGNKEDGVKGTCINWDLERMEPVRLGLLKSACKRLRQDG